MRRLVLATGDFSGDGLPDLLARQPERLLEPAEERLWVNPDCGLKTRGWSQVRPSPANLLAAAHRRRAAIAA